MNANAKASGEPIRLVFELARADHPRLYDDLIQFPKGTKRINRLRVLAYDGLLAQCGHLVPGGSSHPELVAETGGSMITNDLFGPPTGE
ncbi:MAG: hypothetical protein Q7V20_11080 [Aquabacterium sp.]|jgi:hypothetical protein|uniref:hypothetical protein n=1 Tax=Aquabacterium sp. TaxID=1872578 RepID=UPI0027182004|nr:hypothetical protein [Aquabacterium sp.]MDO9003986.1 hypothetical protein [Aquabacterium sp.]